MQNMIPLYKPHMPELPLLQQILYSEELAYGSYTKQFENSLRKFFNTPYVISTNTFNTAISVVLSTFNIIEGDEVIISPMACLASTQPFASVGLKIIWADVNPRTGTLCPESVKSRITGKTKAIVHNHFCGYPGHINEINEIGKENGIVVIDDGIECFGATYKNKKIGNCGTDVTVFSFNPVRLPNTIDGGAIIFKNKEDFEKSILIRDCGIDRSIFRDEMGEININCDISLRGFSATMSNINGYIGYEQMKYIDSLIKKQKYNASIWKKKLKKTKYSLLECVGGEPNYWVCGILSKNKIETIKEFRNEGYYASGVHIKNNAYSIFGDKRELKGVDEFYNRFVALPCGWWVELDN
jgi:dTDP-4-amino-4,6-dideoxygalactose transaminase